MIVGRFLTVLVWIASCNSIVRITLLAILAICVFGLRVSPGQAQSPSDGWTIYKLNMRSGPGANHAIITTLPPNTTLVFEGRNADSSWLLGRTEDGVRRGWVSSLYLGYADGFSALWLPVSEEIVAVQSPAQAALSPHTNNVGMISTANIVPAITSHAREIFTRGQSLGNYPNVFAKVGDCNTRSAAFLTLVGWGQYDLGPYGDLQATIDFFGANSFATDSLAAQGGFTAQSVIAPTWTNAQVCSSGHSPLECEYERIHPSVALIMLGMMDVHFLDSAQYEQGMRQVIEISINRGVIPVLTTFPIWAGENDGTMYARRQEFNNILISLAYQYDVPLINFAKAAESLPQNGLTGDLTHISYSGQQSGIDFISFRGDEATYGYTLWNLLAIQTLGALRTQVLNY